MADLKTLPYLFSVAGIQAFQQDPFTRIEDDWWCETCNHLLFKFYAPEITHVLNNRGVPPEKYHEFDCRCPAIQQEEQMRAAQRRTDSGLPLLDKTFDMWTRREGAENAYWAARNFPEAINDKENILVFIGEPGTGKTHLLQAIGHECLRRGRTVRFAQAAELLQSIRDTYSDDADVSTGALLDSYKSASVLLIDDLGAESSTSWTIEQLTALIDDRYRSGRQLAITTNINNRKDMAANCGFRLADRIFDINTGIVAHVQLTCSSYRQKE